MISLVDWKHLPKTPSDEITGEEIKSGKLMEYVDDLVQMAVASRLKCASLPQAGIAKQLIVLQHDQWIVIANPKPLSVDTEQLLLKEVHPNFAGIGELPIARPSAVRMRCTDITGMKYTQTFSGIDARLLLMQMDYLGGASPLARLSDLKRNMVETKLHKMERRLK